MHLQVSIFKSMCDSRLIRLVFGQLGLNPNTTSLLATGVYGIMNVCPLYPHVLAVI